MYKIDVVENGVQAQELVNQLEMEGYTREQVYIFAHDSNRSSHLTEATHTQDIGIKEQGFFETFGNYFKKRGDELRSKMRAVGMTQTEAEQYEEELDKGKLVVVASKEVGELNNTKTY
ncbi:general stress protein [Bacillus coahuilensis m2-6]|uniref:general stress protein n=1 Tax=Bacillus coahuilensis TaxID=408580 RepID=UPI00018513BF|nr:general stress protein [Bacillus coahuilensis]KUP04987.1 general stress protein [Bacillus coahuilensis m2-6]